MTCQTHTRFRNCNMLSSVERRIFGKCCLDMELLRERGRPEMATFPDVLGMAASVSYVGIKCLIASTLSLVANRSLFAEIRLGISRIGLGPGSDLPIHGMMFRSSISLIGQSEDIDGVWFVFIQLIRLHALASPSFVFREFQ